MTVLLEHTMIHYLDSMRETGYSDPCNSNLLRILASEGQFQCGRCQNIFMLDGVHYRALALLAQEIGQLAFLLDGRPGNQHAIPQLGFIWTEPGRLLGRR